MTKPESKGGDATAGVGAGDVEPEAIITPSVKDKARWLQEAFKKKDNTHRQSAADLMGSHIVSDRKKWFSEEAFRKEMLERNISITSENLVEERSKWLEEQARKNKEKELEQHKSQGSPQSVIPSVQDGAVDLASSEPAVPGENTGSPGGANEACRSSKESGADTTGGANGSKETGRAPSGEGGEVEGQEKPAGEDGMASDHLAGEDGVDLLEEPVETKEVAPSEDEGEVREKEREENPTDQSTRPPGGPNEAYISSKESAADTACGANGSNETGRTPPGEGGGVEGQEKPAGEDGTASDHLAGEDGGDLEKPVETKEVTPSEDEGEVQGKEREKNPTDESTREEPGDSVVAPEEPAGEDIVGLEAPDEAKGATPNEVGAVEGKSKPKKAMPCLFSSAVFAQQRDQMEFFLPVVCSCSDCRRNVSPDFSQDPTALEYILRPWQVEFLSSEGVFTAKQLVAAEKSESRQALCRKMKHWRKERMDKKNKKISCFMALHIWSRTAEDMLKSAEEQKHVADSLTAVVV